MSIGRWLRARGAATSPSASVEARAAEAAGMVDRQIQGRGISDPRVLTAMRSVPRHRFVPPDQQAWAYDDRPLPIGSGQTISQPYIVAFMTEALALSPADVVLEIGTGSGYQTAVLGEIARQVYSVEVVAELAERARATLEELGYRHVHVRHGDGYGGWPEHAPFPKVIVTAAPAALPESLVDQLAIGGTMVVPVGPHPGEQELRILRKTAHGVVTERSLPVRFVPMVRS